MSELDPKTNPITLFEKWLAEAKTNAQIKEPTAMALATSSKANQPHVRIVLLKALSEQGFVFFSNYESRKGLELRDNPKCAAVFYWDPLFKQVKISGRVEKTSREQSVAYWKTRPRESQLSQTVSKQSQTVASRELMDQAWKKADQDFSGQEVPCPLHWGGYLIIPEQMEFWTGQPGRFHDRFEFSRTSSDWTLRRLYP